MLVCVLWFLFFRSSILFLISFREAVFPIECHINISIFWYVQFSLALGLPLIHYYHCRVHYAITHQCVATTVPSLCVVFFSLFYFSSCTLCALYSTLVNFLLASWFDMVVQLVLTINLIGFQSRKIALLSKM